MISLTKTELEECLLYLSLGPECPTKTKIINILQSLVPPTIEEIRKAIDSKLKHEGFSE